MKRVRLDGFALLVMLAAASCTGPQASMAPLPSGVDAAALPMHFRGAEPAIEVTVDGQGPFLFALDTGCDDRLRLDSSLVDRLGVRPTGSGSTGDLSGRQARLSTVQIESLSVGPIRFTQIRALSRNYNRLANLPRIDGILCFDLFSGFLLTLDYPAREVRVRYGDLPPPDGAETLPLKATRGLPSIDMLVGTTRVNTLIDSGNLVPGFLLPGSLEPELRFASGPDLYGTLRTVAGETVARQARLRQTIRFGSHRFIEPMVVFPNVSNNASIGSEVMEHFAVTFDQRNHRVRFAGR